MHIPWDLLSWHFLFKNLFPALFTFFRCSVWFFTWICVLTFAQMRRRICVAAPHVDVKLPHFTAGDVETFRKTVAAFFFGEFRAMELFYSKYNCFKSFWMKTCKLLWSNFHLWSLWQVSVCKKVFFGNVSIDDLPQLLKSSWLCFDASDEFVCPFCSQIINLLQKLYVH